MIEGFYGPPWAHADRLWMLERMAGWGMNLYVYAPKNDPLHRDRWREPYPDDQMREFRELVSRGDSLGVGVGFAISPGLSIEYASSDERAALSGKFESFRDLGARFLSLALDDVPSRLLHDADRESFGSLAEAHAVLVEHLRKRIGGDVTLWFVPTDYVGVAPSPYLEELGERLDPEVEIAWTGRTIVSPTIRADEAARRAAMVRRPLLLWDNVPVSDGPMRSMLHLGPYGGREPGLRAHARGVLLNPMEHARASAVTIGTAARFLDDPEGYEPERAWKEVLREVGTGAPEAFATFAEAHRFHPIWPDAQEAELAAALADLRREFARGGDPIRRVEEIQELVQTRVACHGCLREGLDDARLKAEITPWLESYARETERIATTLDGLKGVLGGGTAAERCTAFLGFGVRVNRRAAAVAQSYGPRRVYYPQIVSMGDDTMALGEDPAVFRDRCLADQFVELFEEVATERLRSPSYPGFPRKSPD